MLLIFCYLGENLKQSVSYGCVYVWFILSEQCLLTELILFQNQRIVDELFYMPWYLLPPAHQREICCAIHWFQNPVVFTIGPFAELNFETAANVSASQK